MKRRRKRRGGGLLLALLAVAAGAAALWFSKESYESARYPREYASLVERYAGENGLPESLVYAVIHTESVFDAQAVSDVDARGLMQIRRDTFEWISQRMRLRAPPDYDSSCFDPEINIRYGTYLLHILYEEFGSYDLALCAYHAGRGNVNRWLQDPDLSPDGKTVPEIPFSDTAWYVRRVGETREVYQRLYDLA